MKTGFQAVKLAVAGFVVPYMFVYSNELLLVHAHWTEGIAVVLTSVLGVLMLGTAVEGYLFTKVPLLLRLALAVSALLLIQPNRLTDIVGVVVALGTVWWQWRRRQGSKHRDTITA